MGRRVPIAEMAVCKGRCALNRRGPLARCWGWKYGQIYCSGEVLGDFLDSIYWDAPSVHSLRFGDRKLRHMLKRAVS